MLKYNNNNISLAKKLRKNMTRHERKLWYEFLKSYEVRFQRQKPIGNYIVDFYCHKANLVIELDGGGHYTEDQMQDDLKGTENLEKLNIRVVRFSNLDVDNNFVGLCEKIDELVKSMI